jgi:threonine/homoserine efflux transporter RhtA
MKAASSHFFEMPHTKLGWWAVAMAVSNLVLMLAWTILPGGGALGLLAGLLSGILALIALIRQRERSWSVFLALLPMLNVFIFLLGEFLIPH